jgi:membrane-associated protease RseP (regulator of RpoE activity)
MSVEHDLPRFPSAPPRPEPTPLRAEAEAASEHPSRLEHIRFDWRKNLVLFLLTVLSVFHVGRFWTGSSETHGLSWWVAGWQFAVPLLVILLCHEFGHYIAARVHGVPASLPYFLPLPLLSPFGTLGAIILMPNRIRSRRALLDIGAAGPLAGMIVAVPIMLLGLSHSSLGPHSTSGYIQEGQSLLYGALKYLTFGTIRADQDVQLHPTALAAWAGFLVTFMNLLPFGQLDGGHVAYALLGERHNRFARVVFWAPLALIAYNFRVYAWPVLRAGSRSGFASVDSEAWMPVVSSLGIWIVLFILLNVMRRATGFEHPPVDDHRLSFARKCVATFTLLLFVLLFMPSPWVAF